MQAILYVISLPIKVAGIFLVSLYQRLRLRIKYETKFLYSGFPKYSDILVHYEKLRGDLFKTRIVKPSWSKSVVYLPRFGVDYAGISNSDHQALRHGALAWTLREEEIIEGLVNYIDQDFNFTRGLSHIEKRVFNRELTPIAMPLSTAFGIAVGIKEGIALSQESKTKFLLAVDRLIACDFSFGDSRSNLRLFSTSFDVLFCDALLLTAYKLSGDKKYLEKANKLFRFSWPLLLAPLTFFTDRRYFLDHIFMFSAWTCIQMSEPRGFRRWIYKHAMRFVFNQSAIFSNPYFYALMHEINGLSDKEVFYVLRAHKAANPLVCSQIANAHYRDVVPCDWSFYPGNELKYDSAPQGFATMTDHTTMVCELNGLALCRSLMVLMSK